MITARTVDADRSLPHQIVLTRTAAAGHGMIGVSCNCRVRHSAPPFGALGRDGSNVWEIFAAGEHNLSDGPLDRLVTGVRRTYAV